MIKNTSEEATFLMTHSWDGPGLSCLVGKRPWGAGLRKTRIKVPQIKALGRLRRNDCSHGISSFPGKSTNEKASLPRAGGWPVLSRTLRKGGDRNADTTRF